MPADPLYYFFNCIPQCIVFFWKLPLSIAGTFYCLCREAKSLFDAKSTVADLRDVQDIQEDILPPTQKAEDWTPRGQTRGQSHDSYDSREGRSVQELNEVIKNAVKDNYQGIELVIMLLSKTIHSFFYLFIPSFAQPFIHSSIFLEFILFNASSY